MWAHVLDLLCCQRPRQPKALHPENQEQNSFSFGGSQGSTTPEAPQSSFDGSTASESEEEPTSKVATAMLKHWRHSESFTQAKLVQDLAAKLQLNAKKYEAGSFFTAAKAKEGFFAVIGQEAFLGGLNLRSVSSMGKSSLGKSLELAWFDNKAAYTERRAFAGSISLHQVQGSSVGPPAGSRYANLDEVTRGQMAGAIRCDLYTRPSWIRPARGALRVARTRRNLEPKLAGLSVRFFAQEQGGRSNFGQADLLKKYNGKDGRDGKEKDKKKAEKTAEQLEEERRQKEQEEKEEEELEKACEKWCSVICKVLIMVPILVGYVLTPLRELALRPEMAIDMPNLSGMKVVVTGGCSGLGLQTAMLMAQSGASVIAGCRSDSGAAASTLQTLERLSKAKAQPAVWDLDMDSLESVRSFAQRYVSSVGTLQILVNNAGTTQGCSLTQDKIESAFQVNYLSHFLLTNGLMPALRGRPARVVHVTCQEGYLRPARGWSHRFGEGVLQGWLGTPVPIQEGVRVGSMRITSGRTPGSSHEVEDSAEAATLREDIEWRVDRCKVAEAYSNAKLAVLAFSRELGRRGISSHAINPNALLTDFKPLVAENGLQACPIFRRFGLQARSSAFSATD
ncbi:unnamed protein product [Effrenium voratum]|uniref:Uncharacterized protein n=1 Tax=Effrenium voratum TaxID=2562239 RepID=A0AA36J9H2_9DINO|nr:unnamed protein product [Effrenium voratum]